MHKFYSCHHRPGSERREMREYFRMRSISNRSAVRLALTEREKKNDFIFPPYTMLKRSFTRIGLDDSSRYYKGAREKIAFHHQQQKNK
ncbi:hypothetical protein NPIL_469841 [Nephila pilipes]|uniref:Uncharacterized protein n=1 Tax=Nephila pilipes TaxID=299642 RepID=A0A8X6NGM5_NEPPI|nr:hypothetical protein NPIL_469841 [Nephila pilipes]